MCMNLFGKFETMDVRNVCDLDRVFKGLIRDIRSYDEEVRVVLEATGHYHLPVVTHLLEGRNPDIQQYPLITLKQRTE